MRRDVRKVILGTVLAAGGIGLVAVSWLYVRRDEPVVWTIDFAPASADIGTQVLNPFRDRSPEICAEHFLERLRDGRIDEALSSLTRGTAEREAQLEYERRHQIMEFWLEGRRDAGDQTLLYFRTTDGNGAGEGCYVAVARDEASWCVTRYERYD